MDTKNIALDRVVKMLREGQGVIALKVLSDEEKQKILAVEREVEKKIVFGMCRSVNQGLREALRRNFTVAMIIQTSEFPYPHHPYMNMICGEQVVGELVRDLPTIEELRKTSSNLFLWENFVIYMNKLPRNRKEREKMRIVYLPREPPQLQDIPWIEHCVFATPSTDSDTLIKQMLVLPSGGTTVGTCLIGFDISTPA